MLFHNVITQNGKGPAMVPDGGVEALAGDVVDADAEVRSKIGSLLMQSDNEKIITLVKKLIRMVSSKVKALSATSGSEDTPQMGTEQEETSPGGTQTAQVGSKLHINLYRKCLFRRT